MRLLEQLHHPRRRFLRPCPQCERTLVENGVLLRKHWFSASDGEQERRFRERLDDPIERWKLSPVTARQITLPERPSSTGYQRTARALRTEVPDHAAGLVRDNHNRKVRT